MKNKMFLIIGIILIGILNISLIEAVNFNIRNSANTTVAYINDTGWFHGMFKWVIDSTVGNNKATFNGTTLWINTTFIYNQSLYADNFVKNGTYPWFRYLNVTGGIVSGGNITILAVNDNGDNSLLLGNLNNTAIMTSSPQNDYNSSSLIFDTNYGFPFFGTNGSANTKYIIKGERNGLSTALVFSLYSNSSVSGAITKSNLMTISTTGLGIGILTPSHKLDVIGTMNVTGTAIFDDELGIRTGSPVYLLQVGVSPIGANLSGVLYVNGTNARVGIGVVRPTHTLNVVGGANITTNLTVANNFFVNASRVGIGTLVPTHTLNVVGNANITTGLIVTNLDANTNSIIGLHSGTAIAQAIAVKGLVTGGNTWGIGVLGDSNGAGAANVGVYGNASRGGANYAGYFEGDVLISANLIASSNTWGTCTAILAVSGRVACTTGYYLKAVNSTGLGGVTSGECCQL